MSALNILVIGLVGLGVVGLIGAGISLIVRYAQTRRAVFLISGLVLSLVVPGLLMCCLLTVLSVWFPNPFISYAPPPP
jgi:hypothetical protein